MTPHYCTSPCTLCAYDKALTTAIEEKRMLRHCQVCDHVSGKHLMNYTKRWQDSTLGRCEVRGCPCQHWVEGERR